MCFFDPDAIRAYRERARLQKHILSQRDPGRSDFGAAGSLLLRSGTCLGSRAPRGSFDIIFERKEKSGRGKVSSFMLRETGN